MKKHLMTTVAIAGLALLGGCKKCTANSSCNSIVTASVRAVNELSSSESIKQTTCEAMQPTMDAFNYTLFGINLYDAAYGKGCKVTWE